MAVFDEKGNEVKNPDYERGYIEQKSKPVTHSYVVDTPEVFHEEVMREYPETGGKDVRIVVDQPEVGHWETRDESGKLVKHFPTDMLEAFPKDSTIEDTWFYDVYIPYTDEQLADIEEQREQAEEEAREAEQRQKVLDEMPDRVSAIESGVNDAFEATAELGVEVADHAVTLDDIMEAIAELGVEMEAVNG